MEHLTPHEVMIMLLALAALLGSAKFTGELVTKFGQPAVLGEIVAGIFLGPTVLGHYRPALYALLFPKTGPVALVIDGVTTIGVVFFLLTAGIEIDLMSIFRQGKSALLVSFFGMIIPFSLGFTAASFLPRFLGAGSSADPLIFALFFGTALSISALPVIAKILMDLNLLRSEMGTVVLSSAMFDDLTGWILFSLVLGMMHSQSNSMAGVKHTLILVLGFAALMLTVGRWLVDKLLPIIQAHTSWPGGVLGFVFTLTLASAAFMEYAGIHAIFGAFITGVAVGESSHLRKRTSEHIHEIVTNVFAPLFFASMGLRTNFAANFHLGLTAAVVGVACIGKLLGAGWGARLGGMDRRTAFGVGLAMNARGAMEIILGIVALQAGLIQEPMFVALVVMALFTSLVSAPAIRLLISKQRTTSLKDIVTSQLFMPSLKGTTKNDAIWEMCDLAASLVGNAPERFSRLVQERERVARSGWRYGAAVPHARVDGLTRPLVVIGKTEKGLDFDARDGRPTWLIILILAPDSESLRELLTDAGELFSRKETVDHVMGAGNFVELMAALNAPEK